MKKVISIALCSAILGLVGCSSHESPDKAAHKDFTAATANHKSKCKHGKCHKKGKLGVEKTEQDTAK